MKLAAFKERVTQNPWNTMEPEKEVNLIKAREKQVENWRHIVYDDLKARYGDDFQTIPDEHFKAGEISYKGIGEKSKKGDKEDKKDKK